MATIRYWAGAKAAAGVETETVEAPTVAQALELVTAARPELSSVVPHCALLLDGRRVQGDADLPPGAVLEVLPPFAGG